MATQPTTARKPERALGLPLIGIIGLALLGVPRAVLHDLGLIHEGTFVNALLVAVPLLIWVGTVILLRAPHPLRTLLAVGLLYGFLLGLAHQMLWAQAFPEDDPQLGGGLSPLDPLLQTLLIRGFALFSSLVTGTAVGAACGVIAAGASALLQRRHKNRPAAPNMPSTAEKVSSPQDLRWRLILLLGGFALLRPIVRMTGLAGTEGQISGSVWAISSTLLITAVWVFVVVLVRPSRPFITLVLSGLAYAVLSAVMAAVVSPVLHGELRGPLAHPLALPAVLLTNALWGAVAGVIALCVLRLRRPSAPPPLGGDPA